MAAQWVNIIYGIWDRQVRRTEIRDDDSMNFFVGRDEQLVRMPIGKYQTLTSDQIVLELML